MATLGDVVEGYLTTVGGKVTANEIRHEIDSKYPNQWKPAAIDAHLYGCRANNTKGYGYHPSAKKYLFRNDEDGTYELYSEEVHGPLTQWMPPPSDTDPEVGELVEASISFERDIEQHLVSNLESIEKGLKLIGRQVKTEVGIIDILAEDKTGRRLVIELKVGEARDAAIGQIARYLGWYGHKDGKTPRGILVAAEFSPAVCYAAKAITNLTLLVYKVHFSFEQSTV